ncbi:MAG: PIN domain-containing protein [Nocardioides sp.]
MILVDTGPLVAAAIVKQPDHRACVDLFTGLQLAGRPLLVPATVVAETGFMLEKLGGVHAEAAFIRSLAQGDLEGIDLTVSDYARMAELITHYDDLPLGTTDASVIALAERLGVTEVATLDRRHFTVVRPRHVGALTLIPEGGPA